MGGIGVRFGSLVCFWGGAGKMEFGDGDVMKKCYIYMYCKIILSKKGPGM
jgi:hypothetical protein